MGDGTYVVAEPANQTDDRVRLKTDWFDRETEEEGKWESVVSDIIQSDLAGDMNLEDGRGTLSRQQAVENLLATDGQTEVESEAKAQALIDFFATEGALELDGNEVVLLKNPESLDSSEMILNWAAAMGACITKIDETLDKFEESRDRLQTQMEQIDPTDTNRAEELMKEKSQELMSLGGGSGFPDRTDLSTEKQARYDKLKEEFVYYKKLSEAGDTPISQAEEAINRLASNIERLEATREIYVDKQTEVRTWALEREIFPEEAVDIAMNMGELATALTGVGSVKEATEEMDDEQLKEEAMAALGDSQDIVETAEESVGEEEFADEASTQMEM